MLSSLDQEHDGHLVAEVDERLHLHILFRSFFFFIVISFIQQMSIGPYFMPTLKLNVLLVFERSRYTEMINKWAVAFEEFRA